MALSGMFFFGKTSDGYPMPTPPMSMQTAGVLRNPGPLLDAKNAEAMENTNSVLRKIQGTCLATHYVML